MALCLRIQDTSDVDLSDASAVQDGIASGEVVITEVIPCESTTAPMASASPITDVGAWKVLYDETDALTGDRDYGVYLDAESGVSESDLPIQLVIGCSDRGVEVVVRWGWDLGSDPIIDVESQIGDGEIVTSPWLNEGLNAGYGRVDTDFVVSLFNESRLALGVTTPDAGPITALFDITGIESAVTGVREACGW